MQKHQCEKLLILLLYIFSSINVHSDTHVLLSTSTTKKEKITIQQKMCPCRFCAERLRKKYHKKHITPLKKEWTILVYMAADNDLRRFAVRNIQQMTTVGSNVRFNVLVHLDIKSGKDKVSEFYYIEKDKVTELKVYPDEILPMDSGNPQTLLEFCKHAITGFPANHYMLVAWNHGTGTINPRHGRFINPSLLFSFNPLTNKLELDRSVAYLDLVAEEIGNLRGVCWDDTTGNYLSNEILANTLQMVCKKYLNEKPFDIIGFDACLMSMVEVASLLKNCGNIVIGSQEVELGTGWHYALMLMRFSQSTPSPEEFAKHIVSSYQRAYNNITNDYTLSAIRLSVVQQLEQNINCVAALLNQLLKNPETKEMTRDIIKQSRDPRMCTHFDEPSYIDWFNLYENLEKNINSHRDFFAAGMFEDLQKYLYERHDIVRSLIVAHVAGKNLINSRGISIYFPFNTIHASYQANEFFKANAWGRFLQHYIYA